MKDDEKAIEAPELGTLRIERRSLQDLIPAPYNPREMTDAARSGLARSIEEFGLVEPIIWNEQTKRVVGGHQRLAFLSSRGVKETDVVLVSLDEVREKALNVALNSQLITGNFTDDLRSILAELEVGLDADLFAGLRLDAGFDHLIKGFDETAVAALPDPVEGECDADEVPAVPDEPVSKPGDLYILGEHRLLCGDSTNPDDVARLLDGAKPRLLVTDPPYGVELDMTWRDRAASASDGSAPSSAARRKGHRNTEIDGDTVADWSHAFELVPSIQVAYVWHASKFTLEVGFGLRRIGLQLRQMLVWRKPQFVFSRSHYHYQSEPAWYAVRKGATAKWVGSRDQSTVWDAASPKRSVELEADEKEDHPTQKPMLCMERPIQNHDFDLIYEPFGGSGTTLIACERQRRRCFAMEIDPKYVDVIVARWERYTGRTAEAVKA